MNPLPSIPADSIFRQLRGSCRSWTILPIFAYRPEIMRHRLKPGVDHLIVHRKHEDVVKEFLHQTLQPLVVLAVYVSRLAWRRGIGLRLN